MNFNIRPMCPEDMAQAAEIEREAFPTTWPPTSFKRELRNSLARYLVAWAERDERATGSAQQPGAPPSLEAPRPLIQRLLTSVRDLFASPTEVADEARDFIAGYVGLWFMVDEAHIISIAVREGYRHLGVGELLLIGAIELAMARRSQRVTLEARVANFPAHALYEKYGFQRTGIRKGYYADTHEDAVIMTAESILSPSYQKLFRKLTDAFRQRRGETIRALA